jgi:hypothetical protein
MNCRKFDSGTWHKPIQLIHFDLWNANRVQSLFYDSVFHLQSKNPLNTPWCTLIYYMHRQNIHICNQCGKVTSSSTTAPDSVTQVILVAIWAVAPALQAWEDSQIYFSKRDIYIPGKGIPKSVRKWTWNFWRRAFNNQWPLARQE